MRTIIILSLLTCAHVAYGDAYLLIDAIALPETSKQPTWLGFKKGTRMLHLPTGQSIVSVEPGTYRLHHIDFHKSQLTSMNTLQATLPNEVVIKAENETITYVGLIQIDQFKSKRDKKTHKVQILTTKILFEWACDKNPDVLARLPVRFLGKENAGKEIRVNCEP